ncbi:subtilisin-like protease 3, putative [Plasmodium ovale]|uniref:subtilisin n=1 Tax=Plasmodium ovale TaxID=36330 RepID=A0A1D3U8X2_PLAOA|nr:subtilisin-like protease 3, putative [Plasmodium ovale]
MTVRHRYYALLCLLFHSIVSTTCFIDVRNLKHIDGVKRKGRVARNMHGSTEIMRLCSQKRLLHEFDEESFYEKRRFIEEETERDKDDRVSEPNGDYGNVTEEELEKLKKKKLIISFKEHENKDNMNNFKNRFLNLLTHCGRVKKLDYINFYLCHFSPEISENMLRSCLQLLSSKRIIVEPDYKIHMVEEKFKTGLQEKVNPTSTSNVDISSLLKSSQRTFKLNSKSNFRKNVNRLHREFRGTNIFEGYNMTKTREGIELSIPYATNDVKVCIVDTGIDPNHVDLQGRIIHMIRKEMGNGTGAQIGRHGNGNIHITGFGAEGKDINNDNYNDFLVELHLDKKSPIDGHGHGTFIAGIIAGNSSENSKGIKGISKMARLIICKALNNNNTGYISDILDCFNYCAEKKAQIINASFASTSNYPSLYGALKELEEKNIFVISSSGNCNGHNNFENLFPECNLNIKKLYPAAYSVKLQNMIVVSNIMQNTNDDIILSPDSCYSNTYVHLAAPGDNIISTYPNNKYAISSGSSFSAAVITGIVSLVLSINPKLTMEEVIQLLQNAIVPTKSLKYKVKWGGFINVYQLITSVIATSKNGQ